MIFEFLQCGSLNLAPPPSASRVRGSQGAARIGAMAAAGRFSAVATLLTAASIRPPQLQPE